MLLPRPVTHRDEVDEKVKLMKLSMKTEMLDVCKLSFYLFTYVISNTCEFYISKTYDYAPNHLGRRHYKTTQCLSKLPQPSKPKIGRMKAHHISNSDNLFRGQGHQANLC